MKLYEAIADQLSVNGVDAVFGLIGDGNLFLVDHYVRAGGGRYIGTAHESAAVLAALGYARVSGRVGVATVTYGPAVTNTVTSMIAGARARIPMVLIAGDTAANDEENLQRVQQRPVAAVAEAPYVQVRSAETWQDDVERAFMIAQIRSRPVFLDIPVNLMWSEVGEITPRRWQVPMVRAVPTESAIEDAVGAIASSRRPLVLAGRGAEAPGSRRALIELADQLGAPLFTTFDANGLFTGEPHAAGIFGGLATPEGLTTIVASDCVISFGASLNKFTTERDSLIEGKTVVVCDVDPERARTDMQSSLIVGGDSELVARSMLELLREAEIGSSGFRDKIGVKSPAEQADIRDEWTLASVLATVNDLLPHDRTMVADAGRFLLPAYRALGTVGRRKIIGTTHFGSIGMGMGYAIGAAIADPRTPVALVTGDGGHMLGGYTEVTTAIRYGLDVTVIVINDRGYGAEYIQFEAKDMDASLSTIEWPDFAAAARAAGGHGFRACSVAELRGALAETAKLSGTRVIDVIVDASTIGDPRSW